MAILQVSPLGAGSITSGMLASGAAAANLGAAGGDLSGTYPNVTLATYRTIYRSNGRYTAAVVTGAATYLTASGGALLANPTANGNYAILYLDPTHYAASGFTTQLRVVGGLMTNDVAPTITFTYGLYPVTAIAGATTTITLTLGAVTTGSTVALTTPAADTLVAETASSAFTFPSAGYYIVGVATSGACAANANGQLSFAVQVRNV